MSTHSPVLFVAWRSPVNRSIYPVGRLLFREDKKLYEFVYIKRALEAKTFGFLPFLEFADLNGIYFSEKLFPLFANRVMPNSRADYTEFAQQLGLTPSSANPMTILARTGGSRETDEIEMFPMPSRAENGETYNTFFLARGIRYFPQSSEDRILTLNANESLFWMWDRQNPVDPLAILLRTDDLHNVGYVPGYLVRDIQTLTAASVKLQFYVERVNPPPAGVHHRLLVRIEGTWPKEFLPFSTDDYQPLNTESQKVSN